MTTNYDRNEAIKEIRAALKARSGKAWSVRGGTGTAWGWITVDSPPRRQPNGAMTLQDAAELHKLLDLDGSAHPQGVNIPSSAAHRREYVARAKGEPYEVAKAYWD